MSQKAKRRLASLDKILRSALGARPDEFGLVLDGEGFVPMKELLAALRSEDGLRGANEASVRELINQPGNTDYELQGPLVRLRPDLASLPPDSSEAGPLPRELFCAVKPAAWARASREGLSPRHGQKGVVLFKDKEEAAARARRFVPDPALISVQAKKAEGSGKASFSPYGGRLWLSAFIPADFLSGPRIKAEEGPPEAEAAPKGKDRQAKQSPPAQIPDLALAAAPAPQQGKRKGKFSDSPQWKTQVRRERREGGRRGGGDRG
jgi:putative RNA 2'-phosphotransferase